MNFLSFLHLFACILFLEIAAYILIKDHKSLVNRFFVGILFAHAVWSFSAIFVHNPDCSKSEAVLFYSIGSLGWCSFPVFDAWFGCIFTGKKKILKNKLFQFASIALPLFFIYKQWTGGLLVNYVKQYYGWAHGWGESVWANLFGIYEIVFLGITLYVLCIFQKESNDVIKKKQAKIIFYSILIPVLLGFPLNIILPLLHIFSIPNIADFITLIWAFGVVYAIARYKFLVITPVTAAENILATMGESLILLDSRGMIVYLNNAAAAVSGYEKKDIVGKPFDDIFEGPLPRVMFNEIVKGKSLTNYEINLRTRHGQDLSMSVSASVLKDEAGKIAGIVIAATDITSRKLSEEALKLAYEQLKTAQAQLVQSSKMASVGQLAGGVAHEINNPLTMVLNNVQLIKMIMREKEDAVDRKELGEILDVVENSAVRCKTIVQSLLDFSRSSKGLSEKISLNEIVDKVILLVKHDSTLKNIYIGTELASGLPAVSGDSQLLQQAVFDIITNAQWAIRRKSGARGGSVAIKTYYDGDKRNVCVGIADTGCGIAPENREKIFDPFFTTKPVGEGTGLGLSIVYSIVKAHGGTVTVESEPGEGACFTISLPVCGLKDNQTEK